MAEYATWDERSLFDKDTVRRRSYKMLSLHRPEHDMCRCGYESTGMVLLCILRVLRQVKALENCKHVPPASKFNN
ncbi:MAG TPA: hypothetical protein P5270_00235 [Victivallales bacterium]|nr:hypothetical protein [Victivallales bacterium]HRR27769.1 hypothetical protein [Victivallales bacterium]HRU01540.1 hypothetical protein [Victivallales bacterium]